MLITKQIEIDMGHSVTNHKTKCKNIHGHRYKIEVGVDDKIISTKGASDEGMVIDFGDLKEAMMKTIDENFDHGFILWEDDPRAPFFEELKKKGEKVILVSFIPTAELLAEYWGRMMLIKLKKKGIKFHHITVWETPTSTAMWTPKGDVSDEIPTADMKLGSTTEE